MSPHSLGGFFIVFEGIDGTGKSTQIKLLAHFLRSLGHHVITTAEPTRGKFGMQIRALYRNRGRISPREELELFIADRREHLHHLILPALRRNSVVICDRYFLSTAAYQGARGFSPDEIITRHAFARQPELALIIEAPIDQCLHRITTARKETPNDFEQRTSLEKVDFIFRQLLLPYIRRVDGSGSIVEVQAQIIGHVTTLLKSRLTYLPHT
jgi:dTMP kinase